MIENKQNSSQREIFCKFFSCPFEKLKADPIIAKKHYRKGSDHVQIKKNDSQYQKKPQNIRHKKNKSFFTDQPPKKVYEAVKTEEDSFKNSQWHKFTSSTGFKKQSCGQQLFRATSGKISISNAIKVKTKEEKKKEEQKKLLNKIWKPKFLTDLKHKRTQTMENVLDTDEFKFKLGLKN